MANFQLGTVGEYTTAGATVNAALISGLNHPNGLAIAGDDLFVLDSGDGVIGEYTTVGAIINQSLFSVPPGMTNDALFGIVVVPEAIVLSRGRAMLGSVIWQRAHRQKTAGLTRYDSIPLMNSKRFLVGILTGAMLVPCGCANSRRLLPVQSSPFAPP